MTPDSPETAAAEAAPAPVTLAVGPEEFLRERAIARVVSALRAREPSPEVSRCAGVDLSAGLVREVLSPSLFGGVRVLLVEDVQSVPTDAVDALVTELESLPEDSFVVLGHAGGAKGQKALGQLRAVAGDEVACARLTRSDDLLGFVRSEARAAKGRLGDDAARRLVEVLGADLRQLAAAVRQLVADSDGPVTAAVVAEYFDGRAEVKGWTIADLAVAGDTERALVELRWALSTGTAPVLVVGALASSVRTLAMLQGAAPGTREADLARDIGVPAWKVGTLRRQLRGWRPAALAEAVVTVATADRAVKGGANDAAMALTEAIIRIGALREAGRAAA